MTNLIDTHCHLTDPTLLGQIDDVLTRAAEAGVDRSITVAIEPADWDAGLRLIEAHEALYLVAGLHPHEAKQMGPDTLERLETILAHPRTVALGEIGLDFHYDLSPRDRQREAFALQLQMARRLGLPAVVHSREAMDETIALLDEQGMSGQPVVIHCFTGTAEEAERIIERGWHISFAGVVTFKNARQIQAAARVVPPERMLIETDSPYLSPAPLRGVRPNEPAHVVHTLRFLAGIREMPETDLGRQCVRNAEAVFGLSDTAASSRGLTL